MITIPFLIWWWGIVGRTSRSAVVGGLILAIMWAAYAQFLGPIGLPDTPLRIFTEGPPPATVHWLNYNQLWLVSLPVYVVTMVGSLSIDNKWGKNFLKPFSLTVIAVAIIMLFTTTIPKHDAGVTTTIQAKGKTYVESGMFYSNELHESTGQITVTSTDTGDRVSPLPPHDTLRIHATVQVNNRTYEVDVQKPMVDDPMGRHTTWWGVGYDVEHHGKSGIGTDKLPTIKSEVAVFGIGDVLRDGQVIAAGVPVHVMTSEKGFPKGAHLELDVGDEHMTPIPSLPNGHLRILWPEYSGSVPHAKSEGRYIGGGLMLVVLLVGGIVITKPRATYS